MEDRIVEIWPGRFSGPPERLFIVKTRHHKTGVFLEKDGKCVHLNSGAELIGINETLQDCRFTRQDFADPQQIVLFLGRVVFYHRGSRRVCGSSLELRRMGPLECWLGGTEKSEAVIRELCRDPQFVFEEDRWTITFNVFKPDGGVDQWRLMGKHDSQANRNEIWKIDITSVKPPGTFSWVPGL